MPRPLVTLLVPSALLFLAAAGHGQACTLGSPTTTGSAQLIGTTCSTTPTLPHTTCQTVQITCDGIQPLDVELRISAPAAGVPYRGTILFGTGAAGDKFYADLDQQILATLQADGFRIVDRRWAAPWFFQSISVRKQSCRYATLLEYVAGSIHTPGGALCATGHSNGGMELAYALTAWNADAVLDVAVPTSGPNSRLDYVCMGWPAGQCPGIVPASVMTCTPPCMGQPFFCTACNPTPTALDQEEDSVLFPAAVLDFPTTRVHQIFGRSDCGTPAVPSGLLFQSMITSERISEFVPAGHSVASTPPGRDAMRRAFLGGAACTAGPASLTALAWPSIGSNLQLDLLGPSAADYTVALSFGTAFTEVPGLGWLFLADPYSVIGSGCLDAAGTATLLNMIPNDPMLVGTNLYFQAQIGSCLSNLVHVQIVS